MDRGTWVVTREKDGMVVVLTSAGMVKSAALELKAWWDKSGAPGKYRVEEIGQDLDPCCICEDDPCTCPDFREVE